MYIPALKTKYKDEIVPALMKEFGYKTIMQVPKLKKDCHQPGSRTGNCR